MHCLITLKIISFYITLITLTAVNQLSQKLSDIANRTVPKISRGVYVKNSHYNQGISDNMVLIEVGAQSNTKEEIQATVEIIAKAIGDYLGG